MEPASTAKVTRKKYRRMTPEEVKIAVQERKKTVGKHFDPIFVKSLAEEIVRLLNFYFRPVYIGFDELPERNNPEHPLIYACNHSGMAFPWDAIMLSLGTMHKHNYEMKKLFRTLAAPALSASALMNPFLLRNLWKRCGAIDATGLNFETMMHQEDTNLLIYPEGIPGIGKGFNRKYQLQTFSTSMIRMSLKYRTDIIGVSCVNGEYINPYSYSWKPINKLVKLLGVPFLPLSFHTPLLLLQPWMFYYAWPAKLTYIRGKRYKPYEMLDNKPWEEVDMKDVRRLRDEIQADMQEQLLKGVESHGKRPFKWREFLKNLWNNWRSLPYWTPVGWPALFSEYDRRYYKDKELPSRITSGWFRFWYIVFKNPIVIAYFIPILGWIPIIMRGLRGRKIVKEWKGSRA